MALIISENNRESNLRRYIGAISTEVTSWEGIKQISAKPFSTSALTNDGNVKICSSYADIYEAQNWENVAYVQMSESYLLGVINQRHSSRRKSWKSMAYSQKYSLS